MSEVKSGTILVVVPEDLDASESGCYWAEYDGGGSNPDVWRLTAVADEDRPEGPSMQARLEWTAAALYRIHNAHLYDPCGCAFCLDYTLDHPDGPPPAVQWFDLS